MRHVPNEFGTDEQPVDALEVFLSLSLCVSIYLDISIYLYLDI